MKYLLLFITVLLISCDPNENKIPDNYVNSNIPWSSVTKYEYEGHEYIKFKECNGYDGYAGVVHNPDCKCFKDSIN